MSDYAGVLDAFVAWWSWAEEPVVWMVVGAIIVGVAIIVPVAKARSAHHWSVPQYRRRTAEPPG